MLVTVKYAPFAINGRDNHIQSIVGKLRPEDYDEVVAATGEDPDKALSHAWANSLYRWSIVWHGEIIGVFGLSPMSLMGEVGVPWLLGTEQMRDIKYTFARQSLLFIRKMLEFYPVLTNFVDARNTLSIKWLKWLGFEIQSPKPFGPAGMPFHQFSMRRSEYV